MSKRHVFTAAQEADPATVLPWKDAASAPMMMMGPKLYAELAQFWARRCVAYADFWSHYAEDVGAGRMGEAQLQFLERMQRDYAQEAAQITKTAARAAKAAEPNGAAEQAQ